MSLFKSWLQGTSSPRLENDSGKAAPPRDAGPRRQAKSTVLLPPPVSPRHPRDSPSAARAPTVDPLNPLQVFERRENELHALLQELLDAQAEGLLEGLGHGTELHNTTSSLATNSTNTHTSASRVARAVPVRQPERNRITLRAARRDLAVAMQQLAQLRLAETEYLQEDEERSLNHLTRIKAWEDKREVLQGEINTLENGDLGSRAEELRAESTVLQEQINEVEMQLSKLRSQQRAVNIELSTIESSVQSKLSSFKGSLALLEGDMQKFLRDQSKHSNQSRFVKDEYQSLPRSRWNMDMATQHISQRLDESRARRQRSEAEREALEEGCMVWNNVVRQVTTFERFLRLQLAAADKVTPGTNAEEDGGIAEVLMRLNSTIENVEGDLEVSESKDWKLLVVAISSELEALRQGRHILAGTFASPAETRSEENSGLATPDEVDPSKLGIERTDSPEIAGHAAQDVDEDAPSWKDHDEHETPPADFLVTS